MNHLLNSFRIMLLTLSHSEDGNWLGEYIEIVLDSNMIYRCPISEWITGVSALQLGCNKFY